MGVRDALRGWLWPPAAVPELRGTHVHTATDYGRDILINSPDGWELDQQHLWWVDGPGGGGTNAFGNPPPDARFSGAGAANLPAVMRCTAIIADTIAGLPWRAYRGFTQQTTPRWLADPQILRPDARLFADGSVESGFTPSSALSSVEFWANWVTIALWFGDCWAWSPRGRVTSGMTAELRAPLYLIWKGHGVDYVEEADAFVVDLPGVRPTVLDSTNAIHLRGEPPYESGFNSGVLDQAGSDLALAAAMRSYAAGIFRSGIPAGYLKVNSPQLTEPQADTLKARWMQQHGGRRSIAVLNSTTEFVPIAMSPLDAQLGEARTWSLRDIALAFGVPAYMLGVPGDSSTYANVESRMTELRTFTLLPWIRRIESALDAQFPAGTEAKIITDGTLRADTSTRFAAYEAAIRAGFLTVDEVRALEDRPPLPQQVSTDPADDMPPPPEPEPAADPPPADDPVADELAAVES